MQVHDFVDEGLGHSSYLIDARGHDHVSVLDGGPDTWASVTGEPLVVGG